MKVRPSASWIAPLMLLAVACSSPPKAPSEPAVFYPAPPDPPRIQYLASISVASDIEEKQSSLDNLLFGDQEIQKSVMAPYGTAVHDGKIYVCDIQQSVVLILDIAGKNLGFIKTSGRGDLQKPSNLEFAPNGQLYVADLGRRQVVVFDKELQYQAEFGPFDELSKPVDLALTDERIYVVDAGSKVVRVLDRKSGEELNSFGKSEEIGQSLRSPTNMVLDEDENVYVVDTIDCRIFVYDRDGKFLRHIGSAGDTIGSFARPKGIAYNGEQFFVIDAAFENCQVFDKAGEPLMYFAGSGIGPGQLYLPAGVWIGKEGLELFEDKIEEGFQAEQLIIITNLYGPRKVNFYALGKDDRFDYDAVRPSKETETSETSQDKASD